MLKALSLNGRLIGTGLLLLIATLLAYQNSFSVPFVFDDRPNILENPLIQDTAYLTGDISPAPVSEELKNAFRGTRMVGYYSFALNYLLGGHQAFGYHLVNLVIHLLNTMLVFLLVRQLYRTPVLSRLVTTIPVNYLASGAAALFALHPVQSQAVTYIVQRFTSLAALFYLLSLWVYLRYRQATITGLRSEIYAYYLLVLLALLAGMKTKEITFTLPLLLLLLEFLFFERRSRLNKLLFVPILLSLLIIPFDRISGSVDLEFVAQLKEASVQSQSVSRYDYFVTQLPVFFYYIRLFLWPINQSIDYDARLYSSIFDTAPLASLLAILVTITFAFRLFQMIRRHRVSVSWLLLPFGLCWFYLTGGVESTLIPLDDIIVEHRLYLPLLGLTLIVITAAERLYGSLQNLVQKKVFIALCLSLPLLLALLTAERNAVYRSELSLWQDASTKAPRKARPYVNIGRIHEEANRCQEGLSYYDKAIKLEPTLALAHLGEGVCLLKLGQFTAARESLARAVELKPGSYRNHFNLAIALFAMGRETEAVSEYQIAIGLNPAYQPAYRNLARLFQNRGEHREAITNFVAAYRLAPQKFYDFDLLARSYLAINEDGEAEKLLLHAVKINPQNPELHRLLSQLYEKSGASEEAKLHWKIYSELIAKPSSR